MTSDVGSTGPRLSFATRLWRLVVPGLPPLQSATSAATSLVARPPGPVEPGVTQRIRARSRPPTYPAAPARPMTSVDVHAARFTATNFRTGYGQGATDEVLDRIAATLDHHGHGRPALRSFDVEAVALPTTRFRVGYDIAEVDAFLAKVAADLRRREGRRPA